MEIYLIRHTSIIIDNNVCYGQSEVELSSSFETEAEKVKTILPDIDFTVVSSPSKRCVKLAESISEVAVKTDKRLLEFNFGEWEMKNWDEIPANNWMNDFVNVRCPGGESYKEFNKRCVSFLVNLVTNESINYCIVTHGGVIRSIISHILNIPLKRSFSLQIDFGSLSKLTINKEISRVNFINRV